jgi:hypothetical protein
MTPTRMARALGAGLASLGLALAGLAATAQPSFSQSAGGLVFTDWTSAGGTMATGTLLGHTVTLTGWHLSDVPYSVVDGSSPLFAGPYFTPPLPRSDAVELRAENAAAHSYTLQLGAPTTDPVLHLGSLGTTLEFPPGTSITRVSGKDAGFAVAGSTITGAGNSEVDQYGENDSNGTVRLNGTFESISFTATTAYSIDGIVIQVGVAQPPTPTPTPAPTPTHTPENVTRPQIRSTGGGVYACDPGEWRNVASPADFTYRWLIYKSSRGQVVSIHQTLMPGPADYGYPIACHVSVAGPSGPVTATSDQVLISAAGLNTLAPAYGDVRIRGIDVFDAVQPNAGARMFGYQPDAPFGTLVSGPCGGGTPTNWRKQSSAGVLVAAGGCGLGGRDPQVVDYEGVTLDRYKRATAVVYVDVAGAAPTDPNLSYDLELSATRSGSSTSLGDPVVVRIKNPPASQTPWVQLFERDSAFGAALGSGADNEGIPITLPSAWTSPGGSIALHARLKFPDRLSFGAAGYATRECDVEGCLANDTFSLSGIPFTDYPQLLITSLELRRASAGQGQLRSAPEVLGRIRDVYPGGSRMVVSPFRADLDITNQTDNTQAVPVPGTSNFICQNNGGTYGTAGPNVTTRQCRSDAVSTVITTWITKNPARIVGTAGVYAAREYDVVFGVHEYPSGVGGNEPGWTVGSILADSRTAPRTANTTPFFTGTDNARPLTAAGHELGHILTAPHAGQNCPVPVGQRGNLTGPGNGINTGETWLSDDVGRLQSTKLVRTARLRGATTYRATVDGPFPIGGGATMGANLVDIMSYCADRADTAAADGNAWVSARNWNRYTYELGQLGVRLSTRSTLARTGSVAARGSAFAVGAAGTEGGAIAQIVPRDGEDAVPASDPSSPFRLRSLDGAGRVLLDAGVTPRQSTSHDGHTSGPFAGPVANGAQAVELRLGDRLLDRVQRTRPPKVRLISPRRGSRVRGRGKFTIRWRASDPDGDPLTATVDFSADGGRHFRTIYEGTSTGRATLSARLLAASRHARVRVRVNDGFNERAATSGPFGAEGVPPQVQILTPLAGDLILAGQRTQLAASAFDDLGRPIPGRQLTWVSGNRRLGRGAQIRVRLPRGARRLTLVARDRTGREGSASVRVRVQTPRLRIVSLQMPLKVGKDARTMNVRIRSSAPATLTAEGRHYRLRTRATTLTVRLPRRPAVGVVNVRFKLSPRTHAASGTIRGTFAVART